MAALILGTFMLSMVTTLNSADYLYRDQVRESSLADERMSYQALNSTEDTGRDDDRLASLGPCPANYTDGNDGNCYKVYTNHSNYHDASNQCKSDGGMLVSIHSKQKNNLIKHMAERAGSLVWLGLKCEHFYWSPICKWNDNGPSTYTEFFEGNPNQIGKCVVMMIGKVTKGKWLSADCDHMKVGFVCQVARKELCGDYQEYAEGRKCYKKIDQSLSQDEAERYCQNECGHLASIHNAKESDIVHGLFNRENNYVRIGLKHTNGTYSWSDNSAFDYNMFGYNDTALGTCVGMSSRDEIVKPKEWINVDCDLPLFFVCQRERGACFNSSKTSDPPVISSPSNCDEAQYLKQNGTIYSPKYPSYYQESKACYYVIASSNESVQIHFDDLQLKQGDTFYIYDALTDLTPSKKIWSTIPSWHNVSSATKVMKIIFVPGSRTNLYENLQGKSRWKIVFDSF